MVKGENLLQQPHVEDKDEAVEAALAPLLTLTATYLGKTFVLCIQRFFSLIFWCNFVIHEQDIKASGHHGSSSAFQVQSWSSASKDCKAPCCSHCSRLLSCLRRCTPLPCGSWAPRHQSWIQLGTCRPHMVTRWGRLQYYASKRELTPYTDTFFSPGSNCQIWWENLYARQVLLVWQNTTLSSNQNQKFIFLCGVTVPNCNCTK